MSSKVRNIFRINRKSLFATLGGFETPGALFFGYTWIWSTVFSQYCISFWFSAFNLGCLKTILLSWHALSLWKTKFLGNMKLLMTDLINVDFSKAHLFSHHVFKWTNTYAYLIRKIFPPVPEQLFETPLKFLTWSNWFSGGWDEFNLCIFVK